MLLVRRLERSGFTPIWKRVDTIQSLRNALADQTWDIAFSDHSMPGLGIRDALALLKEQGLDVPFIIVSGAIKEEDAVAKLNAGAQDYLLKDNLSRLNPVVEGELRAEELKFGKDDRVIAQAPAGKQSTVPSALDSPKDATSESGSGLMRDIESYLGNSAAALARIPRDLSRMTGDLVSDPVDFLQKVGPSLDGLGMSVPILRVGTPRGQPIARIGRVGEDAVGIKPGVPKASVRMLSGTNRYPDIFTQEVIGDVKNVARLSFTQQLQDYAAFAQATGRKFHLYVKPTTKLTGPLNEAILSGQIDLKYIPRP